MTITNGYTTLALFKARAIPNAGSSSADDAVIEDIIEAASRWIDLQTGVKFWTSTNDETRYFTADDPYFLDTGYLVSVTSIAIDVDGSRAYSGVFSASDYDLYPFNASAENKPYTGVQISPLGIYTFPRLSKGVKIVGKFGWASVPEFIRDATEDLATNIYHRRFGENTSGQATITAAGVIITPQDVSDSVKSVIAALRSRI